MLHFRGEFTATDPYGDRYVLLAFADDAGDVTLETSDGTPVERIGIGHYHLARHPVTVELTSDDPEAP